MYPHTFNTYTMPDGTKTLNKPKDGQIFCTMDGYSGISVVWQWDGLKEHWFRKKSSSYDQPHPDFEQDMELANRTYAKCECGSEKVGSPIHSSWCPKH